MNDDGESKKKKSSSSLIKTGNIIKSKVIPYGFSLFSSGFLVFILTNVVNHYLTKYIYIFSFEDNLKLTIIFVYLL
jgi:hypothetical protein